MRRKADEMTDLSSILQRPLILQYQRDSGRRRKSDDFGEWLFLGGRPDHGRFYRTPDGIAKSQCDNRESSQQVGSFNGE
jgi:hypothetical protein